MYTLPGDLIVYKKVDPMNEYNAAGHIDIRTYHNFLADAAWAITPCLGRKPPTSNRYRVIGVFRKISDTMAMVRVKAFLRLIREHVAGETSLADKERSYRLKQYDKNAKDPFADLNGDLEIHPYEEKKNIPAGAYQIKFNTWNNTRENMGWPKTFIPDMQDRVAIYLLQACSMDAETHPRRSALGYIMEGELDEAVKLIKQDKTLAYWPGGSKNPVDPEILNTAFENYVNEESKK